MTAKVPLGACKKISLGLAREAAEASAAASGAAAGHEEEEVAPSQVPYAALEAATAGFNPTHIIGRGGFGAVYRGEWRARQVAVKCLDEGLSRQGEQEFQAEVRLQRSCRDRRCSLEWRGRGRERATVILTVAASLSLRAEGGLADPSAGRVPAPKHPAFAMLRQRAGPPALPCVSADEWCALRCPPCW